MTYLTPSFPPMHTIAVSLLMFSGPRNTSECHNHAYKGLGCVIWGNPHGPEPDRSWRLRPALDTASSLQIIPVFAHSKTPGRAGLGLINNQISQVPNKLFRAWILGQVLLCASRIDPWTYPMVGSGFRGLLPYSLRGLWVEGGCLVSPHSIHVRAR